VGGRESRERRGQSCLLVRQREDPARSADCLEGAIGRRGVIFKAIKPWWKPCNEGRRGKRFWTTSSPGARSTSPEDLVASLVASCAKSAYGRLQRVTGTH